MSTTDDVPTAGQGLTARAMAANEAAAAARRIAERGER